MELTKKQAELDWLQKERLPPSDTAPSHANDWQFSQATSFSGSPLQLPFFRSVLWLLKACRFPYMFQSL